MNRLSLHVPSMDELCHRQGWMADPATMDYNRGYAPWKGYDPETGCIAFPKEDWAAWYAFFIGREPERFYAYIVRDDDGAFLGEVNVHSVPGQDWHDMGIVLDAKYRGQGYAAEALRLLLEHAFDVMGVHAVHNVFEAARTAAIRTHLAAGFREYRRANGMAELLISRKDYEETRMD